MSTPLVLYPGFRRIADVLIVVPLAVAASWVAIHGGALAWGLVLGASAIFGFVMEPLIDALMKHVVAPLAARWNVRAFQRYQRILDSGPTSASLVAIGAALERRPHDAELVRDLLLIAYPVRIVMRALDGDLASAVADIPPTRRDAPSFARERSLAVLRALAPHGEQPGPMDAFIAGPRVRMALSDLRWDARRLAAYESALRARSRSDLFEPDRWPAIAHFVD